MSIARTPRSLAIDRAEALGLEVWMVTGDNAATAQIVAELRFRNYPLIPGWTPVRTFWNRANAASGAVEDDIVEIAGRSQPVIEVRVGLALIAGANQDDLDGAEGRPRSPGPP